MGKQAIMKLCAMSVVIGLLVGLLSDLFIRGIQFGTKLIWQDVIPSATHRPLAILTITLIGGLLMGLCLKYFGSNDGIGFEAVMVAMKKDGGLGVKQLKRVVVNAYIGLISGASIGPEAPLITLGGYVGEWLARRLKLAKSQLMAFIAVALGGSIGVLLNSPAAGPIMFAEQPPNEDKQANTVLIFASMISASIGFGIYVLLKAPFLAGTQLVPSYGGFKPIHLVYGLLIGVIGTLVGVSMKFTIVRLKTFWQRYVKQPVIRGAVVGLLIGAIGCFWPLAMFDGSKQLDQLVMHPASYSIAGLLVLVLARIAITGVSLSGGYQGGNIFPTLFAAGAAGLAIHGIFVDVPSAVAVVACMVSAMYVFVPLPLFTIFLVTEISSFSLTPVMAMALVSTFLYQTLQASKTKPAVAAEAS